MSITWKCPKCGATLRKGGGDYMKKIIKSGGMKTGTATCANCGAKYSQHNVYSGKYDVPEPESPHQGISEDPNAEVPELLLVLVDREPPGGTTFHLQRLLLELPLHEKGHSQAVQVTPDLNNQFFISQAALLQAGKLGFEADLDKLTWKTYSTADGVNGVFVKVYKTNKETTKPDTKHETNPETEETKQAQKMNIFEILLNATCCVMCADKKVEKPEREMVHTTLKKTKAPWTRDEIDKRIEMFLQRVKKRGFKWVVSETCEKLPEFKKRGKEKVLLKCLNYMARADGVVHEKEMKIINIFMKEVNKPPIDINTRKKAKKEKEVEVSSGSADSVEAIAKTPTIPTSAESIGTLQQAEAILKRAQDLYKQGEFMQAIELLNALTGAKSGLVNSNILRKVRAIAFCEAGRFEEAESEFGQLLKDMGEKVPPVKNCGQLTFWYLKAQYKGDEDKANDELHKLDKNTM
jgi:tellurite resistance protein